MLLAASFAAIATHTGGSANDATETGLAAPVGTPISTADELAKIGNDPAYPLSGDYYLANDIVFSDPTVTNFVPIGGTPSTPFTGTFDGNGFSISGMNVLQSGTAVMYAGLFGCTNNAQIYRLEIADSSVKASSVGNPGQNAYAGGIVGYAAGTLTIEDCSNTSTVVTAFADPVAIAIKNAYAGGLVGWSGSSLTATGCTNSGSISATAKINADNTFVGGIVGWTAGPVAMTDCANSGTMRSTADYNRTYLGGLVGFADIAARSFTMTNCSNTGDITSAQNFSLYIGGLVGCIGRSHDTGSITITECYNTGPVDGESFYGNIWGGGVVGLAAAATITIERCFNTGTLDMTAPMASVYAGGVVGSNFVTSSTKIANCYNVGDISVLNNYPMAGGVIGQSDSWPISAVKTVSNCYNAGLVDVVPPTAGSFIDAFVGGVIGSDNSSMRLANCYSPEGKAFRNGVEMGIVGRFSIDSTLDGRSLTIPGNSDPERTADPNQHSGLKDSALMKADHSEALEGNTVYYTGITTVAIGVTVDGWDFENIWIIVPGENGGYPILRAFYVPPPEPPEPPGPEPPGPDVRDIEEPDEVSCRCFDWWFIIPFVVLSVLLILGRWWFIIAAKRRKEEEENK